ncbi:hypothetical protein OIU84_012126 [Salix udensis]|nr:hypothetical protein OIU84_012126 [Salix udensis]
MKHFMLPRNPILREAAAHNEHSPNPSSHKMKPSPSPSRRNKSSKENAPPPDPNSITSDLKHFPSPASAKLKSPLPPRPPSSNPLKRKLIMENSPENSLSDSGVKVIVRMRPLKKADEEEGETIVQKMSNNTLAINGQTFTFDSVADTGATQLDMFQLVGAPLVENCLAGFNSSVFAYGQTGSGKTFTMWGPANALSGENLSGDQQGLTPRVFQRLFDRINEEQIKYTDKQLKYQCRCSFLEIYNEQITDLLDPSQRNLQIREDMQTGVYVENLREEYVLTMKDVTQLLIKSKNDGREWCKHGGLHVTNLGLSNRRTGSTSINAESSRSHSVFTCVVESRCKSMADGMSSLKTSRINLVDLAGSERQKLTGTAGERLKEAGNINRSLSQLGNDRCREEPVTVKLMAESSHTHMKNLINILAEISQTGKQRHIPYRDSRLTFLLQESLGGNAKLAMMCAISPAQSCKSETFSTLRFAQRAKAIKNKAIVNEEVEDDVNHLREVIRQLRDELHRVKANSNNPTGPENMRISFAKSNSSAARTAQTSKSCLAPTEHLAASLHRGLEIIDSHHKSSVFRRLSFRFPSKPAGSNPILPVDDFMEEELAALMHEHKLLKDKYENHPEVSKINIEMKRVQDELENYRNFCDLGEREVLLEEIQDLRSQLQYYTDSSSSSVLKRNSLLKLTYPCEPSLAPPPLNTIQESSSSEESPEEKLEIERTRWMDAESKWISLAEELRAELDANRALAEKLKREVDTEKRCAEELKEAMQMAMEGHARMLEQYADLEERHIHLLARHRRIREGIDDVKKAASKAGVRGAESKFINALAAEISALKAEREKERRYFRDESRGLQAQLRDTAEAVQAAGELLARLKEAEEAVVVAEMRAMEAEQDAVKANKQINKLKRKHEEEISSLKELVAGSRLPKEARLIPASSDRDMPKFDAGDPLSEADQRWREAFEPFYKAEDGGGELSKLAEPSTWFSGYDRCNI